MSILEMLFLPPIMVSEMVIERESSSTQINPLKFSSQDRIAHFEEFHKDAVKVNKELSLMQQVVTQKINIDGDFRIVPIGDTHLGSRFMSLDAMKKMLEPLDKDNAFGFVTGDFIEATNPGIPEHAGSVLVDTGKQIVLAADYLRPYFYAGKLLCTVNGFFGHDGSWSLKWGGIPAVEFMSRQMPMPDLEDPRNPDKWKYLPVLEQGGLLRLQLKNNREYVIRLFHDPSSGGSDNINRSGALKNQFMDESANYMLNGVQVDMYVAGHQHHRGSIAKEMYVDRKEGKEKSVVFVQIGGAKGVDGDNQDPFLVAQGKGPSLGPGPVIRINQSKGYGNGDTESTKELIAWGYENDKVLEGAASMLHQVRDRLNVIERQNMTQELLGKISNRVKKPKAEFDIEHSGRNTRDKQGKSPLFNDVRWNISGVKDFPILVNVLANFRYGSTGREAPLYKKKFDEILKQTVENPFRFTIIGRESIDKGVSKRIDREEVLDEMAKDFGPINKQQSLLGIMASEAFLDDGWKKDVVWTDQVWDRHKQKYVAEKTVSESFYPTDYFYYGSHLEGVPFYENDKFITINLDGIPYTFQMFSKLGNSGSEFYLGQGLVQSVRKEHTDPDVAAGGHMQVAGALIYPPKPRVFLPTGHFSPYIGGGTKGNKRDVVVGGQAAILFPKRKFVWPAANFYEATDNFNALLFDVGLTNKEKRDISRRTK